MKPREFYLYESAGESEWMTKEEWFQCGADEQNEPYLHHVIEKSAYDSLHEQAEKLAAALELMTCDCSIHMAREALADYEKFKKETGE